MCTTSLAVSTRTCMYIMFWGQSHSDTEYLFYYLCRNGGLTDDRLAPPLNPVHSRWFLVCAKVATQTEHLHVRKLPPQKLQCLFCTLGNTTKKSHSPQADRHMAMCSQNMLTYISYSATQAHQPLLPCSFPWHRQCWP